VVRRSWSAGGVIEEEVLGDEEEVLVMRRC